MRTATVTYIRNGSEDSTTESHWGTEAVAGEWLAERKRVHAALRNTVTVAKVEPHVFTVGDGATQRIGSDAHAYTVIKVSPSGKTITLQRDKVTLDPGFKPDFHPGGFVGHVANQHDQRWTYEADPDGGVTTARLTPRGWKTPGSSRPDIRPGRREYYDWNF